MKVFLKHHKHLQKSVIGVCDENMIGKTLKNGKFQYKVSSSFFEGNLISIEDAIQILQDCKNFNAVGEHIISSLIESNILHPEGIVKIDNIPVALKFLF